MSRRSAASKSNSPFGAGVPTYLSHRPADAPGFASPALPTSGARENPADTIRRGRGSGQVADRARSARQVVNHCRKKETCLRVARSLLRHTQLRHPQGPFHPHSESVLLDSHVQMGSTPSIPGLCTSSEIRAHAPSVSPLAFATTFCALVVALLLACSFVWECRRQVSLLTT